MKLYKRLLFLVLVVSMVVPMLVAPVMVSAQSALSVPVTGTFTDALGGLGTFAGNFTLDRVVRQGGQLLGVGTLTGTLTDSLGNVLGTITQSVSLPLTAAGSCQILDLTLGPLDLNLLGLLVHLNQVHLNITAQSGPGNLLGNLLCAVANLLNSNGSLSSITRLLNQILRILG